MGDENRNIVNPPEPPRYDTRRDAMKSMAGKLSDLEARIVDFVKSRPAGGATCAEIEQELKLSHQTCSSRCTALAERGLIKDSGSRRKTSSGRSARVYVAT